MSVASNGHKCLLQYKLAQAEHNVCNGLIDIYNCEPNTFGKQGFKDPEALLNWLMDNQPGEEPVLSHSDFFT